MDMIVVMKHPVHWSVNLTYLEANAGVKKIGYYVDHKGYTKRQTYTGMRLDQAGRLLKKIAHDADWTDLDMIDVWMRNCENRKLRDIWKEVRP